MGPEHVLGPAPRKPSRRTARNKLGRAAPYCHATDQGLDVPGQVAAAKGRLCKSRDGHGHEDARRKGRARHCRLRRKPPVALVRRRQASRAGLARPALRRPALRARCAHRTAPAAWQAAPATCTARPIRADCRAARRAGPPLPRPPGEPAGCAGEDACACMRRPAGRISAGLNPARMHYRRRSFSGASGAGPAGRSGGRQGCRMRFAGANCAPAGRAQSGNGIGAGTEILPASAFPKGRRPRAAHASCPARRDFYGSPAPLRACQGWRLSR